MLGDVECCLCIKQTRGAQSDCCQWGQDITIVWRNTGLLCELEITFTWRLAEQTASAKENCKWNGIHIPRSWE